MSRLILRLNCLLQTVTAVAAIQDSAVRMHFCSMHWLVVGADAVGGRIRALQEILYKQLTGKAAKGDEKDDQERGGSPSTNVQTGKNMLLGSGALFVLNIIILVVAIVLLVQGGGSKKSSESCAAAPAAPIAGWHYALMSFPERATFSGVKYNSFRSGAGWRYSLS